MNTTQSSGEPPALADRPDFDEMVYVTLLEFNVSPAGRIAYWIGQRAEREAPSPQAVAGAFKRLHQKGLIRRAGRSATCWEVCR